MPKKPSVFSSFHFPSANRKVEFIECVRECLTKEISASDMKKYDSFIEKKAVEAYENKEGAFTAAERIKLSIKFMQEDELKD